jgi:hypothetical protein
MPLGLSVLRSKGMGNGICRFDIRKPPEAILGLISFISEIVKHFTELQEIFKLFVITGCKTEYRP